MSGYPPCHAFAVIPSPFAKLKRNFPAETPPTLGGAGLINRNLCRVAHTHGRAHKKIQRTLIGRMRPPREIASIKYNTSGDLKKAVWCLTCTRRHIQSHSTELQSLYLESYSTSFGYGKQVSQTLQLYRHLMARLQTERKLLGMLSPLELVK